MEAITHLVITQNTPFGELFTIVVKRWLGVRLIISHSTPFNTHFIVVVQPMMMSFHTVRLLMTNTDLITIHEHKNSVFMNPCGLYGPYLGGTLSLICT